MDYQEEQQLEIEALEAILADDLQGFEGTRPEGWPTDVQIRCIALRPAEEAAEQSLDMQHLAELVFAHTPSYPDEAPLFKARSVQGLSDADMAALQEILQQQVDENLGMAMLYALVSAAQEWLTEKATAGVEVVVDPEAAKKAAEEVEERRLAELRAHGTPVTPENFAAWKERFYAEMKAARARARQAAEEGQGKLSGKAFFLRADARGEQDEGEEDGEGISEEDIDYSDDDDEGMLDEF